MYPDMSKFGIISHLFTANVHYFCPKSICWIFKTWTGSWGCVLQWPDACLRRYKHKHVKIFIFSGIFKRESPIFPFKIKILKIWIHQHIAEDVCFNIKPSQGNSHAHPKRSVGAVLAVQGNFWTIFHVCSVKGNNYCLFSFDIFIWFSEAEVFAII